MNRILLFINLLSASLIILPMLTFADRPLLLSLDLIEESERFAYDYRMRESIALWTEDSSEKDEDIAIVNIDQASLDRYGTWPWRRDKIATLIKNIMDIYRAKIVVLPQSFLTREDQTSEIIDDLRDRFYYDNAILTALTNLELDFNFDHRLLGQIDGRPVIIGYELDAADRRVGDLPIVSDIYELGSNEQIPAAKLRRISNDWESYNGYLSSDQTFIDGSLDNGFINILVDQDGSVRHFPLGGSYAGNRFFSLPLVVTRYFDDPRNPINIVGQEGFSFLTGDSLHRIGNEKHNVGVDRNGNMLLRFLSTGGDDSNFDYYSARDVMDGNQVNVSLRGRIAIIGTDASSVNDYWRTPVNSRLPGVEVYATALRNIIDGTLVRPHNAWLSESLMLIIIGLVLSYAFSRLQVMLGFLLTLVCMFAVYYVNYQILWLQNDEVYRIVPFFMLFSLMFVINLLARFILEFRQKKKVEGVLNQYIPPELAREVNTSKKGFSMEGEIREMTILFSDVRGFTSISERFSAHELTKFMNRMLNTLSQQIHTNRGTIDKYIGDAVMAFWNAPLDDARHATNAVRGAIGMQVAMADLSKELVASGYPELKMGVGINTGEACVGNMGSEIRLSYTVMGDSVNLASRLEGITKQYGISIIVGERTYELTKDDFIYRPVDSVRVKGKQQAVTIYEPIADMRYATQADKILQEHSLSYWEAYRERRFQDVVNILQTAILSYPQDGLMDLYLNRAYAFLETPPSDDWEPVTTFDTK